jgi:hypothetical protein
MPSKVSIDPEEPSLGRIRADFIAPPHTLASVKRGISRVERNPALISADLFADISSYSPMREGDISVLAGYGPGLTQNKPMALVETNNQPHEQGLVSRRIRHFFKPEPNINAVSPAKVDEHPPKIDEPAPVAPLETPAVELAVEVAHPAVIAAST